MAIPTITNSKYQGAFITHRLPAATCGYSCGTKCAMNSPKNTVIMVRASSSAPAAVIDAAIFPQYALLWINLMRRTVS